jgi:magnesium chelatase subunit H
MDSWVRDGIAGLQSVVLYSLPELDGAIDTVPLGGLVGDNIYLVPERVKRLSARVKKWVELRRKEEGKKKVAVVLYGFPPGVGATGTAALLNVPKSLESILAGMRDQGYDLGGKISAGGSLEGLGEALVSALRSLNDDQRAISMGKQGVEGLGAGAAAAWGARATCAAIPAKNLRSILSFPPEWGPSEWGPIPFLPDSDVLVTSLERQWGDLDKYR